MRHILLHHHIFKNAGSTLDFALRRQFGADLGEVHNLNSGIVDDRRLREYVDGHPNLRAVTSHHFHCQDFTASAEGRRYRFIHLALVRKPIARFVSIYKFYRRSDPADPLAALAREVGAPAFMRTLIDRFPYVVDNPQVNIFSTHGYYVRPVSHDDLQTAYRRYASYALCGPVERYDEAMVTLEYFCSPAFAPSGLDLAYIRQNESGPTPGDHDLREFVTAETYDHLRELNSHDQQFWAFANAELDRRVRKVPNFQDRLARFRARCEGLSGGVST